MLDQTGKPIERKDLKGTPWIVGFDFTAAVLAPVPRVTAQMRLLREQTNVRTVTITVDPDFDTPEVLARYAQTFGGTKPDDRDPVAVFERKAERHLHSDPGQFQKFPKCGVRDRKPSLRGAAQHEHYAGE